MELSLSLVAREAGPPGPSPSLNGFPRPAPPKTAKKPKKAVLFFEVEILDAKTREKLCFLDKVGWEWGTGCCSLSSGGTPGSRHPSWARDTCHCPPWPALWGGGPGALPQPP